MTIIIIKVITVIVIVKISCNVYLLDFCLQHGYYSKPTAPILQHTAKQEQSDQCGNTTA